MYQIIFDSSQLKSDGYEIFEAVINNQSCYAFQMKPNCDQNFRQQDLLIQGNYLRKPFSDINLFSSSKYALFENYGQLKIQQITNLNEEDIAKILSQLMNAILNLHKKGTLGRCFNIDNIIIDKDNNIMLMDFGFGSPLTYIPIECLNKQILYDHRYDAFLIGRIGFYLIIGYEIPNADDYMLLFEDTMKQIKNVKLYSDRLKNIIKQLLHYDADKRLTFERLINELAFYSSKSFLPTQQDIQFYKQFPKNLIYHFLQNNIRSRDLQTIINLKQDSVIRIPQVQVEQQIQLEIDNSQTNRICQNLHFDLTFKLYKFQLLNSTREDIEKHLFQLQHTLVPLSIYFLKIIKAILYQQFINDLKKSNEYESFRDTSEYQNLLNEMLDHKYIEIQQQNEYYTKLFEQLPNNYVNNKYYQEVIPVIEQVYKTDTIEINFKNIKQSYRLVLSNLMIKIDNLINADEQLKSKLQLKIFMCTLINHFNTQKKIDDIFTTIKKYHQVNMIYSPLQIEYFLIHANNEQLNEQWKELERIFQNNNNANNETNNNDNNSNNSTNPSNNQNH